MRAAAPGPVTSTGTTNLRWPVSLVARAGAKLLGEFGEVLQAACIVCQREAEPTPISQVVLDPGVLVATHVREGQGYRTALLHRMPLFVIACKRQP
jgi:hypothetical protein